MIVLFVCSGNVCRSPLAAVIFGRRAEAAGIDGVEAASAGTLGLDGCPADPAASAAAAAAGYDLSRHLARPLTRDLLLSAGRIVVMEDRHLLAARALAPERSDARRMTDYLPEGDEAREGGEVPDPVGGSPAAFRDCVELLERCVDGLVRSLAEEAYFGSLAARVARARGGEPALTPLEFDVVDGWWRRGVPLWLAIEAIEAAAALWAEGRAPRSLMRRAEEDLASRIAAGEWTPPE